MAFKENLLKKMSLDRMRQRVFSTLGPSAVGIKLDKTAMKELLKAGGFRSMHLRGLDLYTPDEVETGGKQLILVLDNELAVYHSTLNDVLMRKEPTLKEMISIKNAMKILNDKDVVVSRKEKSVDTVYKDAMARLDLRYSPEDIKQLEYEGRAAVEWNDTDAVTENLSLFSELLGYEPEPKALRIEHHLIRGAVSEHECGGQAFGPSVVYNTAEGTIRLIKDRVHVADTDSVERFMDKALGRKDPDVFGPAVIVFLGGEVLRLRPEFN